jgi:hypothetical protein
MTCSEETSRALWRMKGTGLRQGCYMNLSQMIVRRDDGVIKYRAAGITHRAAAVSNIPSSGRDSKAWVIGGRGLGNGSRCYEKGTALIFRSKAHRRAVIVPERAMGLMHGSSGPPFQSGWKLECLLLAAHQAGVYQLQHR